MKNYILLLLISTLSSFCFASENCGIDENYLESFGFILYGVSELSEKKDTTPLEAGSLIFSWNPACQNEDLDTPECATGNCDHECGAIRTIKTNGEAALNLASQLSSSRPEEVVLVGWANSNKLDESTGLPYITAKLYVPDYKILSIQMSPSGTLQECQDGF